MYLLIMAVDATPLWQSDLIVRVQCNRIGERTQANITDNGAMLSNQL